MSKKRKSKIRQVRADPAKSSWLLSDAAFDTLCVGEYTRLVDNPEILAAVNKIADLISTMTIHQMENTEKGDVRIKDGLSAKVDISPNRYMTRKNFIAFIVRTLLLYGDGNSIVIPETSSGYLENLLPIPGGRFTFTQNGNGYKVLIDGQEYNPDNLLHFAINPDRYYPWRGTGYRTVLKDVAQNLRQAAATKKGFMESKWKPPVIVKVDSNSEELSTPSGREKILEDYVGTTEAGQPWVIPAEQFEVISVKPLSLNDLALKDGIELDKRTVASVLDVPPFVLGIGSYSKDEWNNFINTRIKPICNVIEQELTRKLLISPARYFRFNVRSLYAYDIETLKNVGADLYTRGMMTGNEVRDWIGLTPKEGLDELVILENYIPQGMIGDQKKLEGGDGSGM